VGDREIRLASFQDDLAPIPRDERTELSACIHRDAGAISKNDASLLTGPGRIVPCQRIRLRNQPECSHSYECACCEAETERPTPPRSSRARQGSRHGCAQTLCRLSRQIPGDLAQRVLALMLRICSKPGAERAFERRIGRITMTSREPIGRA